MYFEIHFYLKKNVYHREILSLILAPSLSVVVLQAKVSLDLITSLTLWHLMLDYIESVPPSTHQIIGGFKDITTDISLV